MSAAYAMRRIEAPQFADADGQYAKVRGLIESEELASLSHDLVERRLEEEGRELMRLLLQAYLCLRGQEEVRDEAVVGADGVERTHIRVRGRNVSSIFGSVRLDRTGHGYPGAGSVFPVDAELNLPVESHSLEVRRRAADVAAFASFEETTRILKESTGVSAGKRQVEELVARATRDFDAFYEERSPTRSADDTSETLVLSIDRKGVVVRHQDLREKARKAAKKKPRLDKRRTVAERRNRKRLSVVAAVYTVAPWVRTPAQLMAGLRGEQHAEHGLPPRPKPEGKRIWASVAHEPELVVEQAFREALARDPERKKRWVVLVDGDRKQLCWIKRAAERHRVNVTIILDVIHVIEYLWMAAHAFHGDGNKRAEAYVAERLKKVLEGKPGWVAGGMRRAAENRGLPASKRKRVERCANYLRNYSEFLRYDRALAAGLPIGTGVVEGACRYLVGDRLDITGARWSLKGAEAVLRLRALRGSGDFDEYWDFHRAQEYRRNHGSHYAAGAHPRLRKPSSHRDLRLVA